MSNDPFLHAGLTPNTDVELYPSAASGGGTNTPVTVSTTATGTATVTKVLTLARTASTAATGTAGITKALTLARTAAATATATPAVGVGLFRSFAVTATGVVTESHVFTPAPPPPEPGLGYGGPALGTFYVQALAEFPTPCRCHKGRPTKACALHCRLIEDRQRCEDELLVLALV